MLYICQTRVDLCARRDEHRLHTQCPRPKGCLDRVATPTIRANCLCAGMYRRLISAMASCSLVWSLHVLVASTCNERVDHYCFCFVCVCVHATGVCSWLGHEERRATVSASLAAW